MLAQLLERSIRTCTSSNARAAAAACVALLAGSCGGQPPQRCALDLEPFRGVIRSGDDQPVDPPECAKNGDCGARPHAEMTCFHDQSCMPLCQEHWGDCNHDYRDGCETPIKHPTYCDGDPRINASSPPSVTFFPEGEKEGPGQFYDASLDRSLGRSRPQLEECYQQVLASTPRLKAVMRYRLHLSEGGCVSGTLIKSDVKSKELETCMARFLKSVRLQAVPEGGSVVYTYDVAFVAGSVSSGN